MLYRGDNTQAFDNEFLTVTIENPNNFTISKAEIRICNTLKTIQNPQFPLKIGLTEQETKNLKIINEIHMAVYDEQGRKMTCEGELEFSTKGAVV